MRSIEDDIDDLRSAARAERDELRAQRLKWERQEGSMRKVPGVTASAVESVKASSLAPDLTRWRAAVEAQSKIAELIAAAPVDADLAPDLRLEINAATHELDQAWRELHAAGRTPSQVEWRAAYEVHGNAMFTWARRRKAVRIAQLVEQQRADGEAALGWATRTERVNEA